MDGQSSVRVWESPMTSGGVERAVPISIRSLTGREKSMDGWGEEEEEEEEEEE